VVFRFGRNGKTDRRRRRRGADLPALPPDAMAELIRAFAAALRHIREQETEQLRLTLYKLELLRDGIAELRARDG
jgi:hypothetical protein